MEKEESSIEVKELISKLHTLLANRNLLSKEEIEKIADVFDNVRKNGGLNQKDAKTIQMIWQRLKVDEMIGNIMDGKWVTEREIKWEESERERLEEAKPIIEGPKQVKERWRALRIFRHLGRKRRRKK